MATKIKNCSFCGKSEAEVANLIAGKKAAYICDKCITEGFELLTAEPDKEEVAPSIPKLPTPKEIKTYLDDYVIGQEYAKKVLAVAVYNHYKRVYRGKNTDQDVELSKSNILLIGPTGSGKTLLAETLAKMLHVPFAIADATTLTEAGYVGEDVENILHKLLQRADYDVAKAEQGIIYIDEIDKISRKTAGSSLTRDVSGEGVQQALLKLIEGTIANIPPHGGRKTPQQQYIQINTTNILFICGGAFVELEKVILERTEKTNIGFLGEVKSKDDAKAISEILIKVEPEDLIKFGLIPEFVGRLPIIAALTELDEAALINILTQPKNAITKQYQKLFAMEEVQLKLTPAFLHAVAKKALTRKTGARGLRSIIEEVLLEPMYDLPSWSDVKEIIFDEPVLTKNEKPQLIFNSETTKDK